MKLSLTILTVFCIAPTFFVVACLPPPQDVTKYMEQLEQCELHSSTCLGYVACRKRVAEENGRPAYNGKCKPAK